MLFSEPKIPQFYKASKIVNIGEKFQCSSASRKFLNGYWCAESRRAFVFQCSSASRKFLNCSYARVILRRATVSVLFSEPKIPQSAIFATSIIRSQSFSALQRAENSSIAKSSSATRRRASFSALQRAENSSIHAYRALLV